MDNGGLGRKLAELRMERKLSQRDLAAHTPDLTATGISRIERGERYPSLVSLEGLAKGLRCKFIVDPGGTRCQKL
jgi:transcriptional regulator with XRE-family HTH domain